VLQHASQKILEDSHKDIKVVNLDPGKVLSDPTNKIKSGFIKGLYHIFEPILYLFSKDDRSGAKSTLNYAYMDYGNLAGAGYYSDGQLKNISSLADNASYRKKVIDYSYDLIKENYGEMPPEFIKYFN